MKIFQRLLGYSLIASTTNNFVWFALTYFAYLETKSVISTGIVSGVYLVATSVCSLWFGSLVDHYKKKNIMLASSLVTLILFTAGFLFFNIIPANTFKSVANPALWIFIILLLLGAISGNILAIAIPTLVGHVVPKDKRDRANGLFGTVMGISFAITSVASGFVLAFGGMTWVLGLAIGFTLLAIVYLLLISVPEKKIIHTQHEEGKKMDVKGTIKVIKKIPGLFALIFYTTFNNFVGGVFMALMDAYGLTLVSVQVWGLLWGFLSFGFILGGAIIAKRGLGKNPLHTLFKVNIIVWTVCIFFTIQPSIILLTIGSFLWLTFFPFIEAAEQTIIQRVVPPERMGRVFGFAHSVEQAASPLTAFLIGPITQFYFIPFMTTGAGVDLIGHWFGTGPGRGIALVFIMAGVIGLTVAFLAMRTRSYKLLSAKYEKS